MLEVKNVSKQYKGEDKLLFDAVSDVSLSMADHRIYALAGESGCGKSTLSRLILGLESPSSGQILYGNQRKAYEFHPEQQFFPLLGQCLHSRG